MHYADVNTNVNVNMIYDNRQKNRSRVMTEREWNLKCTSSGADPGMGRSGSSHWPKVGTGQWSCLREAVCLRHGGKQSLKSLTFGPSCMKMDKRLSVVTPQKGLPNLPMDPTGDSSHSLHHKNPVVGWRSALTMVPLWQILDLLLQKLQPQNTYVDIDHRTV